MQHQEIVLILLTLIQILFNLFMRYLLELLLESGYLKEMKPTLEYLYNIILNKYNNKKWNLTSQNEIKINLKENIKLKEYNINGLLIELIIIKNDYTINHGWCSNRFDFYGDFDVYDAKIGITLNINNEENIEYILSHELLHLYQLIKTFNNNRINKDIENTKIYQKLYNEDDIWNYFINTLYYFLNSEESARINSILHHIKNSNPNNTKQSWDIFFNSEEFKYLNQYKNFDFKKHLKNVNNIDEYINKFKELKGDRTRNTEHFISYWSGMIKSKINNYEKKLYKKINLLNYEMFGKNLNETFYSEISEQPIFEFDRFLHPLNSPIIK